MKETQQNSNILAKEEREKAINEIISYFLDERNEEIGIIAANNILDFFEKEIGKKIYNKALDDSRIFIRKETEDLDYKISELRK